SPGAPGGDVPQYFPERLVPVEYEIRDQRQCRQPLQPRAGQGPLQGLGHEKGSVSQGQTADGQQPRRQGGQQQGPAALPMGQGQEEQPPQQHRSQGGGPGAQAVVIGVG